MADKHWNLADRLSVDPVTVVRPEPMKTLWKQPDEQLVVGGGVLTGGGLSVETIRKCRALFV